MRWDDSQTFCWCILRSHWSHKCPASPIRSVSGLTTCMHSFDPTSLMFIAAMLTKTSLMCVLQSSLSRCLCKAELSNVHCNSNHFLHFRDPNIWLSLFSQEKKNNVSHALTVTTKRLQRSLCRGRQTADSFPLALQTRSCQTEQR